MSAGPDIDFPDCRASLFLVDPVLGYVAIGADRNVELGAVRAGDEILGPVMVEGPSGEIDDFDARRGDLRFARFIRKPRHGVGVGDVEIAADERHAEWRIESFDEEVRVSTLPSPSPSRSSVIRLALGWLAPARFCAIL